MQYVMTFTVLCCTSWYIHAVWDVGCAVLELSYILKACKVLVTSAV